MDNKQLIQKLTTYRDEALELNYYSKQEALEMYEYLRGNQLPLDVINTLKNRGQPLRWENIIREIDNSLDGLKRMSKTEIQVVARHEADNTRAEILQKIHKATIDSTEWNAIKARADLDLRVAGLSIIESYLHPTPFFDALGKRVYEIKRNHIPAVEALIDMYSRQPDYSDARYFMHERLYDIEGLKELYGDNAKNLKADEHGMVWVNRCWHKIGKEIYITTFSENVILEHIKQPYTKTEGRFNVSVRRSNFSPAKEYYGIYRDIRPIQDDINNMMLRLKNMLGSYKMLVESSAVDDAETFAKDFALDNSVTVLNDGALKEGKFKEINLQSNIAQIHSLIQDARATAIRIVGVNPEILGSSTTRQSGVALEIKQNAALTGMQRYLSNSNELDKDIFEVESAIIEEYFTAEQVFNIVKEQGEKESFYLNEYVRDSNGRIVYENGKPKQKNILSFGRYDFTIVQVPFNNGSADAKMKNWAEVMKIIDPQIAQSLIPTMLEDIGSSQAKKAKEVIEQQSAQAQNNPAEQMQLQKMQLDLQKLQAQIAELMGRANKYNAEAQVKAAELNIPQEEIQPKLTQGETNAI